jgi:hypothetical protein
MPMLVFCYSVMAISSLYCIWLVHERAELRRRNRALHDRVTFLLCTMAKQSLQERPVVSAGLGRSSSMGLRHRGLHTRWKKHSWHAELWQAGTPGSFSPPRERPDGRCMGERPESPCAELKERPTPCVPRA